MGNAVSTYDLVICGGGLSGLLTAWACAKRDDISSIAIIDAGDALGGDHTWSFNEKDLSPAAFDWVKPAIKHQWPAYNVHFPAFSRELPLAYCSTDTVSIVGAVASFIEQGKITPILGVQALDVTRDHVQLSNGEKVAGKAVLDARGYSPSPHRLLGYQKFVGHVVEMAQPHGLDNPIIMDATVTQHDGYRFVYCLPYSATSMLIEDTYYEDGDTLDDGIVEQRIADYAASKNWTIAKTIHTERGILPITLASNLEKQLEADNGGAPKIGLAGGLYHAVTGYSFPDAARMASEIAALSEITNSSVELAVQTYRSNHWRSEKFFRLLNRMLFKAGNPQERYKVLQRFYTLDKDIVSGFYRGDLSMLQKLRILSGKPPVPIGAAMYNFSESQFFQRHGR